MEKDQATQREYEDCSQLQKNYNLAVESLAKDDYESALRSVNYCLGKIPDNSDLLIHKAEILAKTGQIDEATGLLRKIDAGSRPA